jgi:hypothetical protein
VAWAGQQIVSTYYANGNYSWTCPADVSSVVVECWGAGGGGGGANANYVAGGGGAGGSYVRYTNSVTPGATYNLTVGTGGIGGFDTTLNGATGGSSYFGNTTAGSSSGASVLAVGGAGGTGSGTLGTSGTETSSLPGGAGSTSGNIPTSGVGFAANVAGSSGGTSTPGGSGTATSGAGGNGAGLAGSSAGGAGGAAVVSSGTSHPGLNGSGPGGGGSGVANNTLIKPGGSGADGQVSLTYTTALSPATAAVYTNNIYTSWICPSNVYTVVIEATGGGGGGGGLYGNYAVSSGGAGGSYVRYTNSVTPGTLYNLIVGAGGVYGSYNGGNGGTGNSSCFGNTAAGSTSGATVIAVGGAGGTGYSSSTAGTTSAELGGGVAGGAPSTSGDTPVSGANLGANTAGSNGGSTTGNGTSAGAEGTAASGAGGAGAPASGGSYTGGAGAASVLSTSGGSKPGLNGIAPGGGGSGGANKTLMQPGGAGGDGRLVLTYAAIVPTANNSTVSASPTAVAADGVTTSTITVTLLNGSNPVSGKTVTLAQTGGSGATISAASGISSSTGVVTFTVTSTTSGSATFTATDTSDSVTITQTASVNFTIVINHYGVTTSTSLANAGQVFTATVQAYATAGSGSPITNNGADGTIVTMANTGLAQFDGSGNGTFTNDTMPLTNGTFTISVRDPKAETITLTATNSGVTGTSSSVSIATDAGAQLQVLLPGQTATPGVSPGLTGSPTIRTAGASFNITVNEVDTNWNVVSSSDTVQITAGGDADAILPANTALSAGTVTLAVTNILAGSGKTLTASDVSDGSITSNTSSNYTVVPAAATRLVILAPGESLTPGVSPGKSGSPTAEHITMGYSVTVDALDAYYNLATNTTDTVGVTSSVAGDTLPANAALVLGTKVVSLTNNTLGSATLTASDISNGSVSSGTTTVSVNINSTTTTLASSLNPVNDGVPFTLTATVTSSASSRTGTVTFMNGAAVLRTSTLSGNTATLTLPGGGAGTYSITASYSGDSNNSGSTSSTLSQVIQTGGVVGVAQLLQDGQDYPVASATDNPPGRGPWEIAGGSSSTSFIIITNGDLSGATSPDIRPLTNSINPEAKLQVGKAGTNSRWYYRPLTNSVSAGSVYYSFLLNVTANPTTTGEFMGSMIASAADNSPAATDPLTIQARKGADSSHFDLGLERLNGTTQWTGDLVDNTTYLIVMEYTFGSSSTCSLFVNPTPGAVQPSPTLSASSDGVTPEPTNIGTVLFYESATNTSGTYQYDVLRADTNWATVTPAINSASAPGAAALAFSSAPQRFVVNSGSGLITLTLEDQSNNACTATANLTVSLNSSSAGGVFLSGADDVTVITNVTIPAGTSSATFYYNDSILGSPTITATNGLLTPATQSEYVLLSSALTLTSSINPTAYPGSVIFTATVVTNSVAAGNATGNVLYLANGVLFDTEPLSNGSATTTNNALPAGTNTIVAEYSGDLTYIGGTNSLSEVLSEPLAATMTVYRTAGTRLAIALSDMATNWTDLGGSPVSLTGVNLTTTNGQTLFLLNVTTNSGTFVINNTSFVGYTNGPNVNDQFSYSIVDGNGGTNIGLVNIVILASVNGQATGLLNPGGNAVTVNFAGLPGYGYSVQRSTNLVTGSGWVTIWTTNAPVGGLFNYTDNFSDLGGAPSSAYYRLSWSP